MSDQTPHQDIDLAHGRDQKTGRFSVGNPGGPGRPRRAVEADYLAALSDAVSVDRWRKIVERALSDAEQGDPKAREWLSAYLAGKPTGGALRRIAIDEMAGIDPIATSAKTAAALENLKNFNPFASLADDSLLDDLADDDLNNDGDDTDDGE